MPHLSRRLSWAVALLLWAAACKEPSRGKLMPMKPSSQQIAPSPSAEPPLPRFVAGSAEQGKLLVGQFECNRCHEGTGLPAPSIDKDCVRCHEQIATDQFKAPASKLAQWKPHIMPYRDVPSLTSMGERLRPEWVMDYLLNPRDLRPNLAQTMPRLALSQEQARDITTYLLASKSAVLAASSTMSVTANSQHIQRGRELVASRACVACHATSGQGPSLPQGEPPPRTIGLAPDLSFVGQRSEPDQLARWLLQPSQLKSDAAMPSLGLRSDEARDIAAFLAFAGLAPPPPRAPPIRLPILSRRVGFEEVNERVFAVTCRHCHTNPDLANGDGGPGNTGGFGFPGLRIDFSSYQGIQSGSVDPQGKRVSLFTPTKQGVPRLVAVLLARGREHAGQVSSEVRGMPLGLPSLTAEQIQLVESWVDQGRPL